MAGVTLEGGEAAVLATLSMINTPAEREERPAGDRPPRRGPPPGGNGTSGPRRPRADRP